MIDYLKRHLPETIVQVSVDEDPEVLDKGTRLSFNVFSGETFTGTLEISLTDFEDEVKIKIHSDVQNAVPTIDYERTYNIANFISIENFMTEVDDRLGDFSYQFLYE